MWQKNKQNKQKKKWAKNTIKKEFLHLALFILAKKKKKVDQKHYKKRIPASRIVHFVKKKKKKKESIALTVFGEVCETNLFFFFCLSKTWFHLSTSYWLAPEKVYQRRGHVWSSGTAQDS